MKITYIYILKDPLTRKVRYVGKSNCPEARYKDHLKNAKTGVCFPVYNWIRKLARNNNKPMMMIIDVVSDDEWVNRERFWIALGKKCGWDLLNCTEGGEGSLGHGLFGESAPGAKLKNDDIKEIVSLWKSGKYTKAEIARMFNVTSSNICIILNGKSRKRTLEEIGYIPIKRISRGLSILTEKDVEQVLKLWMSGEYTQELLSKMFNVNAGTIGAIVRCENWVDISKQVGYKPIGIKKCVILESKDKQEIQMMYSSGNYTMQMLAECYDTTRKTISKIVRC